MAAGQDEEYRGAGRGGRVAEGVREGRGERGDVQSTCTNGLPISSTIEARAGQGQSSRHWVWVFVWGGWGN